MGLIPHADGSEVRVLTGDLDPIFYEALASSPHCDSEDIAFSIRLYTLKLGRVYLSSSDLFRLS